MALEDKTVEIPDFASRVSKIIDEDKIRLNFPIKTQMNLFLSIIDLQITAEQNQHEQNDELLAYFIAKSIEGLFREENDNIE